MYVYARAEKGEVCGGIGNYLASLSEAVRIQNIEATKVSSVDVVSMYKV